jgi:hypothetical protein
MQLLRPNKLIGGNHLVTLYTNDAYIVPTEWHNVAYELAERLFKVEGKRCGYIKLCSLAYPIWGVFKRDVAPSPAQSTSK